jgi:hypothetical protein
VAHAEAQSAPDGRRRHRRAEGVIAVAGVAALGLLGAVGGVGGGRPPQMALGQAAPTWPTGSTDATTPFDDVPPSTVRTAPEPAAIPAEPAPVPPEPAPSAAGPPTTVTTARPARNAPRPTTTTTAAGTVEARGAAALTLIDYPWQRTGYSIVFAGPNDNLLGLTEPSRKRITIYLRPSQSIGDVARIIGHEIGHAVDFTMTTDAERADYRRIRGLDDRPWYPTCGACADYASPVGDWAETFAYWLLGNGSFNSQLAGKPTSAQLAALTPLFTADPPAAPTTTTTARPATTPTTATGGTATAGYWYGSRYRQATPTTSSGGRTRRRTG